MNYFPFDPDPHLSAIALDDKRLTRVFHEATMTLSKAQFLLTGELGPYSPRTPIPSAIMDWVTGDGERWFVAWTSALLAAMVERYGQARIDGYSCYQRYRRLAPRFLAETDPLPAPATFPNLARAAVKGLDFTGWKDTHAAYREYMRTQWNELDKRPCTWEKHGPPTWARNDDLLSEIRRLGLF